jgi:hypothetical protein
MKDVPGVVKVDVNLPVKVVAWVVNLDHNKKFHKNQLTRRRLI